ncbi:MAG: dTMP kinase [Candidatus Woesearchaeota archaeon]
MPPAMRGRFIVIDGPDYCGKGTQHRMLVDYLLDHPLDRENKLLNVVATREPFNTQFTLEIRRILKESMDPKQRASQLRDFFFGDRWEHVDLLISPALKAGCIVVSDRYKYSTEAYQSAQGLDIHDLVARHSTMPVPDIAFFLEIPLEEAVRRRAAQKNRPYNEIFDRDNEFMRKVQEQYALLKEIHGNENIVAIDANKPKEDVFERIRSYVDYLIFKK